MPSGARRTQPASLWGPAATDGIEPSGCTIAGGRPYGTVGRGLARRTRERDGHGTNSTAVMTLTGSTALAVRPTHARQGLQRHDGRDRPPGRREAQSVGSTIALSGGTRNAGLRAASRGLMIRGRSVAVGPNLLEQQPRWRRIRTVIRLSQASEGGLRDGGPDAKGQSGAPHGRTSTRNCGPRIHPRAQFPGPQTLANKARTADPQSNGTTTPDSLGPRPKRRKQVK